MLIVHVTVRMYWLWNVFGAYRHYSFKIDVYRSQLLSFFSYFLFLNSSSLRSRNLKCLFTLFPRKLLLHSATFKHSYKLSPANRNQATQARHETI